MAASPDERAGWIDTVAGPVLVFAASNFPFAFSVCGGDTASALAAGCPVVVKAHPGHPRLSNATAAVMVDALRSAGAPDGALGLVHGYQVGVDALRDPRIKAGAFTGSIPAGRALHDIAVSRPGPIPFYGEYADAEELLHAAEALDGNLTATVHAADSDAVAAARLLPMLQERAGRVIWNGWPTGVAVSWAMQHGGPFLATAGSIHTSVDTTAARRFQRPVCYQSAPEQFVPEVLRNKNRLGVNRRVNGAMTREDIAVAKEI